MEKVIELHPGFTSKNGLFSQTERSEGLDYEHYKDRHIRTIHIENNDPNKNRRHKKRQSDLV